jgi:hypothetical protein
MGGLVLATAPANLYASTIDLTTSGASVTTSADLGGTFTVTQINPQSTGTGVIDSFLRIQANGAEAGYNTDLGTPLDDKGGGFTRSLLLSEVPIVDGYYQFLLDVNQLSNGDNSLLSLNQIQIFQAADDQLHSSFTDATATTAADINFASASEVFRLSGFNAADAPYQQILLNYALNPGSGAGDMFLYVAASLFNTSLDQVILFSQFGIPNGGSASNDGFEEWAVLKSVQSCVACSLESTPEPGSLLLLGSGITLAAAKLRRRKARHA